MEELQGGREGQIFKIDDRVHRPSGVWSNSIHTLLAHLKREGFKLAPDFFGFDDSGNEIVSYIPGKVYNYPLEGPIACSEVLCAAASLLRQYHDATVSFVKDGGIKDMVWLLPSREPQEVICHGDFAPYNVVLDGAQIVGIIDFDTAHPAPRLWDIAYAVYCWAPFKTNQNDAMGDIYTQSLRAKQFCTSYGLSCEERFHLVDMMIRRVQALVDYMEEEAKKSNEAFIANINDGHHLAYLADIDYLKRNKSAITEALMSKYTQA